MTPEFQLAKTAAELGAEVIRRRFRTTFSVEQKVGDKGVVTEVDHEAEQAILRLLRENSSFDILSEEDGASGGGSGPRWVVDPLDGTTNFSRGLPLFAVSVALLDSAEVRVGAIADPIGNIVYAAERGRGVFAGADKLSRPPRCNGSPAVFANHGYAVDDCLRCAEVIKRLGATCSMRGFGSTALELSYVASGRADGFLCSGDELWDYAAGLRIAMEAGCRVSDWRGRDWDNSSSYVLVAAPDIHASLVAAVRDLQVSA